MTEWYIIANPTAGQGAVGRRWPKIAAQLRAQQIPFVHQFTTHAGQAPALVAAAAAKGYRNFLAIGGDGTLHEVVNGIMTQGQAPSEQFLLSILPIGTGNDWIRTHNWPKHWRTCLANWSRARILVQDVGQITYQTSHGPATRFFANVAGMAYDGYVVATMAQAGVRISSRWLYLWWVAKSLWRFQLPQVKIHFNDQEVIDYCYTINVGIGRYSGGGMQFVPQAIADDGLLALTFARRVPKWEVLLNTPRFYRGTLGKHPKISLHQSQRITVQPHDAEPVWLEADGELLGQAPAAFSILPNALRLWVPPH